jgi:outer membrane lipoprotein SlyB
MKLTKNIAFDYTSSSLAAIAAASALVLAGCGDSNESFHNSTNVSPAQSQSAPAKPRISSAQIGNVSSIEEITERPKGTGVGAVTGGVIGGVLGNQVGDGNGQKAATAVGAIGGAVLGNNVERNYREKVVGYRIHVRLDNGETRSFQASQTNLQPGDRVRIDSGEPRRA